ncbi:hypothetical protein MJO29_008035, partial [Puccinia striiformis f. sp. tritici]
MTYPSSRFDPTTFHLGCLPPPTPPCILSAMNTQSLANHKSTRHRRASQLPWIFNLPIQLDSTNPFRWRKRYKSVQQTIPKDSDYYHRTVHQIEEGMKKRKGISLSANYQNRTCKRPADEAIETSIDKLDVDHDGFVPCDHVLSLAEEEGLGIFFSGQDQESKSILISSKTKQPRDDVVHKSPNLLITAMTSKLKKLISSNKPRKTILPSHPLSFLKKKIHIIIFQTFPLQ